MCSVVWIVWSPDGRTEMHQDLDHDRGEHERRPPQGQVGEGGEASAGERNAREDQEVGESDDHVDL